MGSSAFHQCGLGSIPCLTPTWCDLLEFVGSLFVCVFFFFSYSSFPLSLNTGQCLIWRSELVLLWISPPAFLEICSMLYPLFNLTISLTVLRGLLDRQLSVGIILIEATKLGCIAGWPYRPRNLNCWALELSHLVALVRYNVIGWISKSKKTTQPMAQTLKQQKLLQYQITAVFFLPV